MLQKHKKKKDCLTLPLKVIFQVGELYPIAADGRRICLQENIEETQMKVNHITTFYMYNPILQIFH